MKKTIKQKNATPPTDEALLKAYVGKLASDTARYIPAMILPAGFSIIGTAIYTRVFEPLHYGRYALAFATAVLVSETLGGWIQQSVLRYLPSFRAEQKLEEFIAKIFVVLAVTSLVVVIIFIGVYPALKKPLSVYAQFYFPVALVILSEVVFLGLASLFQAQLKSKQYAVFNILRSALRLALALGFVFLVSKDVVGLLVGTAVANLLMAFTMMHKLGLWRNVGSLWGQIDFDFTRRLFAYGMPIVGWMLCGHILGISDRFVISVFRGNAEVGIYSANYNLVVMGFGLVSTPILMAAHPIIMNAWEKGTQKDIPRLISVFSRYYLIAALPLTMFVAVFCREIVTILLGNDFREGFAILPIVMAGVCVWGLSMYGHKGLELLEKTNLMLTFVTVSACLNLVLNIIIVPKFGYLGASVTTFISYLSYSILVYHFSKSRIPWRIPWETFYRVLLSIVLTGAVLTGLRYLLVDKVHASAVLVAGVGIGLPVYLGSLICIREIKPSELRIIWKMSKFLQII